MQNELRTALEVLRNQGTILYPTDTIWGIGCDASSEEAVKKIYSLKERDNDKSMLILVADEYMAQRYLDELPDIAYDLFMVADKPLTLVLPGAKNLARNLPAKDGSIGMRIPDDAFCQSLLQRFRKPIVSTSANFSGQPAPAGFRDIDHHITEKVDYVVKWRQNEPAVNKASSVIRISTSGEINILRK